MNYNCIIISESCQTEIPLDIAEFRTHAEVEDVHWWFRARREIILDQLRKVLPPGQDRLIAEIGCGTGGNLKFLNHHYRVIGVDVAPEAVAHARTRVNCDIFLGDFREVLESRWQQLDGVILADVLEHIDDDRSFLRDVAESLKKDAVLLITVPAHAFMWSRHDIVLGHRRRYSKAGLRSLWKELPVEEIFFSPFNCFLFPAIFLFRMLKMDAAASGQSDLKMPSSTTNHLLYRIFSAERALLRRRPLPWGISYMAALRKKGGA
ncbi:MAG: class I SAM-dependent methyltransferase [Nitrospirota bacterium]|nr:class I SAM-dependent methyltransferase [Nitrospirota bacterium]